MSDASNKVYGNPSSNNSSLTKLTRVLDLNDSPNPRVHNFEESPDTMRVSPKSKKTGTFGFNLVSCDPGSAAKSSKKGHKKNLSIECNFDAYDLNQKLLEDEASDELLDINSIIFRHKMKEPEFQDDSDSELDEDSKALFVNAQGGTKMHRKDLLQYIVKTINGMGGIRTLHKIFIE